MTMPFWTAFFQRNILQGTNAHALATTDALLRGAVLPVVGGELVETPVDHITLQPGGTAWNHLRKAFLIDKPRDVATHANLSGFDFFACVFLGVELVRVFDLGPALRAGQPRHVRDVQRDAELGVALRAEDQRVKFRIRLGRPAMRTSEGGGRLTLEILAEALAALGTFYDLRKHVISNSNRAIILYSATVSG